MLLYTSIVDANTKTVNVGIGSDEESVVFYNSIGMVKQKVEQGHDGQWYLKGFAPKIPLEEIKDRKKSEINQIRDSKKETEGADYAGDLFDIDDTSKTNILGVMMLANMNHDGKFTYRSKSNKDHELNASEITMLGIAIAQKIEEIYQKSWDLKAEVESAKTLEEVEAVIWE